MERRNALPPIHPGEIIKKDILPSVGLSVTAAAKAVGVSRQMLLWRHARIVDAVAGGLRPEEG